MDNGAELLRQEYCRRRRRNTRYSLRSFARDLDLNPGTLSAYLNGKRSLSDEKLNALAERLSWSPDEKSRLFQGSESRSSRLLSDQDHFQIIAEWEHYAIYSLIDCEGFESSSSWIAGRLGISVAEVDSALRRLQRAGLVDFDAHGTISKSENVRLRTTDDVVSSALKKAHEEMFEIARDRLFRLGVEQRDFSSVTFTGSLKQIHELKQLIRDFRARLAKLADGHRKEQVFQLSIQLFPLTQPDSATAQEREYEATHQ